MNLNERCGIDALPNRIQSSCGSGVVLTVIKTDFESISDRDVVCM